MLARYCTDRSPLAPILLLPLVGIQLPLQALAIRPLFAASKGALEYSSLTLVRMCVCIRVANTFDDSIRLLHKPCNHAILVVLILNVLH